MKDVLGTHAAQMEQLMVRANEDGTRLEEFVQTSDDTRRERGKTEQRLSEAYSFILCCHKFDWLVWTRPARTLDK